MSYRSAVYGLESLGVPSGPARITCDGCGLAVGVTRRSGQPYAWLLAGRGPPKWLTVRHEPGIASHYCPTCKGLDR